jgi:tetratricopeptide (TPR) repeat protein
MKISLSIAAVALVLLAVLLYGSVQRIPEGRVGVLEREGEVSILEPGFHVRAPFSDPAVVSPVRLPEVAGEAEIMMTDGGPYRVGFTVSGVLVPERAAAFHRIRADRSVPDLMKFVAGQALARVSLGLPSEALAAGSVGPLAAEVAGDLFGGCVDEVSLSLSFDSPRTLLGLARSLAPSGQAVVLREAVAAALEAAEPGEWEIPAAMGLVLESEGEFRAAEEHYLDALSIMPSALEPMAQLYAIYTSVGEEVKLTRLLGAAIQHDPTSIQHLVWLTALQMKQGEYDAAIETARRALEIEPENARLINNLGGIYLKEEKLQEAISMFRRAVGVAPRSRLSLYNLGVALSAAGEHEEGLSHLLAAEETGPARAPLLEAIAAAYRHMGDQAKASDYRRRAREAAASPPS